MQKTRVKIHLLWLTFHQTYNIEKFLSRFFCLSPEGVATYVELGGTANTILKCFSTKYQTYNIEKILSRFFCLSPEGVVTYVELGGKRRKVPKFTDINS